MTNLVPFNQMQAPAHLQHLQLPPEMVKQMNAAAALGTGGGGSVPKISLKAGRFRLQVQGAETVLPVVQLQIALLRVNDGINKTWFEKQWNPNDEPTQPECSSDDGITPRIDSPKRQSNDCASCPHNQWGSSINPVTQKKGKACQDSKRMALVPPGNSGRFDDPEVMAYQLAVPPASLSDFGGFVRQLSAGSVPAAYNMVVVEVSFDTTVSYPKLNFRAVRWLEGDEYSVVASRYADPEIMRIAGLAEAQGHNVGTAQAGVAQIAHQPAVQQQPVQQQAAQQPQQNFAQPQQQAAQQNFAQPQQNFAQPQQQATQQPAQNFAQPQQQPVQQPQQNFAQPQGQAFAQPQNFAQPQQAAQNFAQPQQQAAQNFAQPQGQQPAEQTQAQPQQQSTQQPATGQRERGKPSPGKTRRNAQEIAEDKAADEADAAQAGGQLAQQPAQNFAQPQQQAVAQDAANIAQQNFAQPQQQAAQNFAQPQQQAAQNFAQPQQQAAQNFAQPQQTVQQQAPAFDQQNPFAGAQQQPVTGAPNQPGLVSGDIAGGLVSWDDPV